MSGEVIRIQQMIFPEDEKENHKLYYSGTGYERTEAGLYVTEGGRVELFTYFNGFFVKQWKRYTQIRNPFAELLVQGNCRLALLYKDAMILTEKYTGKKMPDRNVCQAQEA